MVNRAVKVQASAGKTIYVVVVRSPIYKMWCGVNEKTVGGSGGGFWLVAGGWWGDAPRRLEAWRLGSWDAIKR